MSFFHNNALAGASGQSTGSDAYQISKSLRFDAGDTSYLSRGLSSNGNKRTWTYATWFKNSKLSDEYLLLNADNGSSTDNWFYLRIEDDDCLAVGNNTSGSGASDLKTNRKFRDPGAWMHLVVALDTTQSTASERIKIYINGKQETSFSNADYPSQNAELQVNNSSYNHNIGFEDARNNYYFSGYLADVHLIDGLQLSPAAFGSFDDAGNWNPKEFALPAPNDGTTWSNGVTLTGSGESGSAANLFDGSLTTNLSTTNSSDWIEIDLGSIAFSTFELYGSSSYDQNYKFHHAGGIFTWTGHFGGNSWKDFSSDLTSPITKVEFKDAGGTGTPAIAAIRVDGVILVDGQTDQTYSEWVAASPNPPSYTDSVDTSYLTNYGIENLFDGSSTSSVRWSSTNTSSGTVTELEITFSPAITVSSKLRFNAWLNDNQYDAHGVKVNDGSYYYPNVYGGDGDWVTSTNATTGFDTGTLSKLTFSIRIDSNGQNPDGRVYAIEVDDVILNSSGPSRGVNSFHLKFNDTSSNAALGKTSINDGKLADANGGLPIHNTTDDYGATKGSGLRADSSAGTTDGAGLLLAIPGDTIADVHATLNTGSSNKTITNTGSVTTSTEFSKYYGTSIYFNNTGSVVGGKYLSLGDDSDLEPGSSNFTAEAWVYLKDYSTTSNKSRVIFGKWDSTGNGREYVLAVRSSAGSDTKKLEAAWKGDFGHNNDKSANDFPLEQWVHVAMVRNGGNFTVYQNGNPIFTKTGWSGNFDTTDRPFMIGWADYDGEFTSWNGYMQDVRFYKTAKYTGSFKPSYPNDWTVTNLTASNAQNNTISRTISGHSEVDSISQLFDGDSSTNYRLLANNGDNTIAVITFGTALNGNLTVLCNNLNGQVTAHASIDGGSTWSNHPNNGDHTFTFNGVSNLTELRIRAQHYNGYSTTTWKEVKIDGVLVVTKDTSHEVDSLNDTPTNYKDTSGDVRGNFCTWNPLAIQLSGHGGFRQGNLEIIADTAGSHKATLATMAIPSTGKWYWEVKAYRSGAVNNGGGAVGVAEASATYSTAGSGTRLGEANSSSWVVSITDFDARHANNADHADYLNGGTAVTDTEVIGIAVDMDNDKMWLSYANTWGNAGGTGNPATGANPAFSGEFAGKTIFPAGAVSVDSGDGYLRANFGARGSFKYTPPTGFKALCTQNLDDLFSGNNLNDPSKYFDVKTFDGTGDGTTNTFKGLNFQPEFLWFKRRNSNDISHVLYDAIRGTSNALRSNVDDTESAFGDAVVTPTSDGFTITGSNTGGLNNSGDSMVGYFWDAGTAAATASTDGSITPSAQWVNATAGFSISKWTGTGANATIGHGLSAKPHMLIVKRLNSDADWRVYHQSLGNAKAGILQSHVGGSNLNTSMWQSTDPTNTVVSLSSDANGNASGDTYVMYCWTEKFQFSKFGTYTGNGNADGPMINLSFRPKYFMFKETNTDNDSSNDWYILDSARSPDNEVVKSLKANEAGSEATDSNFVDFLSNGVKFRTSGGAVNGSGDTYLFAAFASNPFKTARAS